MENCSRNIVLNVYVSPVVTLIINRLVPSVIGREKTFTRSLYNARIVKNIMYARIVGSLYYQLDTILLIIHLTQYNLISSKLPIH